MHFEVWAGGTRPAQLHHYFADTAGWLADPKKGPAPAQRMRGAQW